MRRWLEPVVLVVALAVCLAIAATLAYSGRDQFAQETRVRYPNEEALARKACGTRRLMYWWIEDPRKDAAKMHVRCTGVVHVETEVKF